MKKPIFATFLALVSLFLGGCSTDKPEPAPEPGAENVRTAPNRGYQTPALRGPVPRNPDMQLSSDISRASGFTHSRGSSSQPYVALTFDDGPHPQNTPRLLDILRARNVKATFYVIGSSVAAHPHIVRRIIAEGHEIGNHTYNHPNLAKLSDAAVFAELDKTRDAIVAAVGVQPRTMRPPYGSLLQRQREMIYHKYGYPTILWSVDPMDWKRPGPSVVTSRILSGTNNGAIILAHDLHKPTVDAMPATVDGLLRRGYKFVTVSQLLAQKAAAGN